MIGRDVYDYCMRYWVGYFLSIAMVLLLAYREFCFWVWRYDVHYGRLCIFLYHKKDNV